MILKEEIFEIVSSGLKESQFIVEIQINPGNKIVIAIDDFNGLSLETCVEVSRHIESSLDREKEDFELEVGSPGLMAPFKVPQQYQKNIGKEVDVLLKSGEKYKGVLLTAQDQQIELESEEVVKDQGSKKKVKIKKNISIDLDTIKQTKLVVTF